MIVAFAGRRVDPKHQDPPHFPTDSKSLEVVRGRIRDKLLKLQTSVLVSSAACGADLLALIEAGTLRIRRRVILPFDRAGFRSSSVTDRPGNWGALYDVVLDEVQAVGDLVIAPQAPHLDSYVQTNHIIIEETLLLAEALRETGVALRAWEGQSRGPGDLTEEFGAYAHLKGLRVCDVLII